MRVLTSTTPPSMPPAGEVLPLVGYSPWWLLIGLALLLAVPAYFLIVAYATRRRTESHLVKTQVEQEQPWEARERVRASVDAVERAYLAGNIDARTAHEQLSAHVRDYVTSATGIPADRMTLVELQRSPLHGTARAVSYFYPGVFATSAPADVASAVRIAREVLDGWP